MTRGAKNPPKTPYEVPAVNPRLNPLRLGVDSTDNIDEEIGIIGPSAIPINKRKTIKMPKDAANPCANDKKEKNRTIETKTATLLLTLSEIYPKMGPESAHVIANAEESIPI